MTLYWWSHWFWITLISSTIHSIPISSVDSISHKALQHNSKNYNKREPLKFPLAAQTDMDDVVDGEEAILRNDWNRGNRLNNNNNNNNGGSPSSSKILENSIENNTPKTFNNSIVNININNNNNNNSNNNTNTNSTPSNNLDNILKEETNSSFRNISLLIQTNSSLINHNVNITNHENQNFDVNSTEINVIETISSETNTTDEINDEITGQIILNTNNVTTQIDMELKRKSKILSDYQQEEIKLDNITNETKNLLARSATASITQAVRESNSNGLSEALQIQDEYTSMNAGAISGICLAVIGLFCGVFFVVVVLYRRRYINKPQTLSEPDSSGYIDDSTIRDNSDEMYSLDNDSFLNSLEAMTIQNYWTDNVKHTKL